MWKICMLFCYVLYKKIDSLGKHAAAGREREAVHIQQLGNCKHTYTLCVEWIGAENFLIDDIELHRFPTKACKIRAVVEFHTSFAYR